MGVGEDAARGMDEEATSSPQAAAVEEDLEGGREWSVRKDENRCWKESRNKNNHPGKGRIAMA